jgi:hypothetical protein
VISERGTPAWLVGVVGLGIGLAFVVKIMLPFGVDPTVFLRLGGESPAQTTYARGLLGDVVSRRDFAHDGRWFFIQANDPWYLEPQRNAAFLDRPVYRAQRMLFPTIASGLGLLPPGAVVWSLLLTNLIVLALGSFLAAGLAGAAGLSPWLGLSFPLNPGLLFELEIGGAGILAFACCVGGAYALARDRRDLAAVWFAAAALTKESMLLFAVGVFALLWLEERRPSWRLLLVPGISLSIWFAYVSVRLAGVAGAGGAQPAFAPPFTGIAAAFRVWRLDPLHLAVNIAIVGLVLAFVPLAVRSRISLAWGALPFIALATVLSFNVWRETHDFVRALAPVFTAIPFVATSSMRGPVTTPTTVAPR